MAGNPIEGRILEALEASAADQGLDVVDVELAGPKSRPTLRVRLDVADGGTIDMDRVTEATPWVSEVVEGLDLIAGAYDLEVSSPGIDRPLRRACDFARFVGEQAELRCREAVDGRKGFTGTIGAVEGDVVTVVVDGAPYAIEVANVERAKLKPDFAKIMAAAKKAEKENWGADADPEDDDEDFDAGDADC